MKYPVPIAVVLLGTVVSLFNAGADEPPREGRLFNEASNDETLGDEQSIDQPSLAFPPATTFIEARSRARLLHETIRGTLQIMHRDFFDEENAPAIPSASMEDVFDELSHGFQVDLKWLIVETDITNVDHQADGEFELAAVKALKSGAMQYEALENNRYRFAGPIRLASQCLKCHVKHRTSTEDRTAGLLISMPVELGKRLQLPVK